MEKKRKVGRERDLVSSRIRSQSPSISFGLIWLDALSLFCFCFGVLCQISEIFDYIFRKIKNQKSRKPSACLQKSNGIVSTTFHYYFICSFGTKFDVYQTGVRQIQL